MINRKQILMGFIFLVSSLLASRSLAQGWNCFSTSCGPKHQQWVMNVNVGATPYYGDLSVYDKVPLKKLQYESRPAYGGILTRYFGHRFGLSIQFLRGRTTANYHNISFKNKFFEYNLHGRVNLLGLLNRVSETNYKWDIYAGIGQFFYVTNKHINSGPDSNSINHEIRIPEFVYFFGTGVSIPLSSCFSITTDLALRQCQTDRLDDYIRGDDYDYYSHLSLGFSWHLGNMIK